ncbi:hypothetical protein GQ42DRAFT_169512 [Ramicandelaber brevisporus]|nr:hypothetical protein GQ42DRAFT_169512 [Ramicandelaber brevisporus]
MVYGSFTGICNRVALPSCRLLGQYSNFTRSCNISPLLSTDRSSWLVNVGDFSVSLFSILVGLLLIARVSRARKRVAVGQTEMVVLFTHFVLVMIMQSVSAGWSFKDGNGESELDRWMAGVHTAVVVSFFIDLLAMGLTGYQLLPDGSTKAVSSILLGVLITFFVAGWIALGTSYGVPSALSPYLKDGLVVAPALFTILFIVPLACIGIYLVAQTLLVCTHLAVSNSLWWLVASLVAFAAGQVISILASQKICEATNKKIDGLMFGTLLTLIAMVLQYVYWSKITEEDDDSFVRINESIY